MCARPLCFRSRQRSKLTAECPGIGSIRRAKSNSSSLPMSRNSLCQMRLLTTDGNPATLTLSTNVTRAWTLCDMVRAEHPHLPQRAIWCGKMNSGPCPACILAGRLERLEADAYLLGFRVDRWPQTGRPLTALLSRAKCRCELVLDETGSPARRIPRRLETAYLQSANGLIHRRVSRQSLGRLVDLHPVSSTDFDRFDRNSM